MVKKNTHGFTLVELFAVILIASTIMIPLLSGYINNFTANNRMHDRKSASAIALSSIEGFNKLDYESLYVAVDEDPDNLRIKDDLPVIKLQQSDCELIFPEDDTTDDNENDEDLTRIMSSQELCMTIFEMSVANRSFDEENFTLYLYPYRLTKETPDLLKELDDDALPQSVENEILSTPVRDEDDEDGEAVSALRITPHIVYDTNRGDDYVISGILTEGYTSSE